MGVTTASAVLFIVVCAVAGSIVVVMAAKAVVGLVEFGVNRWKL